MMSVFYGKVVISRQGLALSGVRYDDNENPASTDATLHPEECEAMASAGIIREDEQSTVRDGTRLFTVEEYLEMEKAGILHEDDRIELMDGKIIIMAPIGDPHEVGTDWLTMLLAPGFGRTSHSPRAGIHPD